MLIKVIPSNKPTKKYEAVFSNGKSVHFGLKGSNTYLDNGDKIKREHYLKRHITNENWNDPYSAGALSARLIWGQSTNLQSNIKEFNRRFFK
jgi:hypothetical protein